jgi:hypothetical protein
MKLTGVTFVLLLALGQGASADAFADGVQALCNTLQQVKDCSISLPMPYATIKKVKFTWFKYNSCKTKQKYNLGFGIKGWTCIPGTDATIAEEPVGLEIGIKNVDLCDLAFDAIPGLNNILDNNVKFCRLIPKLASLSVESISSLGSGDLGEASAVALKKFGEFEQVRTQFRDGS